ncbi:hypothetical protein MPTK2_8g17870 [Marchantia polymorpha subsp. ruderalis]
MEYEASHSSRARSRVAGSLAPCVPRRGCCSCCSSCRVRRRYFFCSRDFLCVRCVRATHLLSLTNTPRSGSTSPHCFAAAAAAPPFSLPPPRKMEADQRHLEPYDEAAAAAAGGARTSYREADRVTVRNVSLRYLRVMISSGDVIENAVASDAILSSLHQHQAVGHWQGRLVIGPRRGQKNVLIRGFQKIHLRACGFSAYDEKRPKLVCLTRTSSDISRAFLYVQMLQFASSCISISGALRYSRCGHHDTPSPRLRVLSRE